jgi:hypothetical protein
MRGWFITYLVAEYPGPRFGQATPSAQELGPFTGHGIAIRQGSLVSQPLLTVNDMTNRNLRSQFSEV